MHKLRMVLALGFLVLMSSAQAGRGSDVWAVGSKWQFTILDKPSNKPVLVTFVVQSGKARSCMGGEWKKLRKISSDYKNISEPAYILEGKHLTVLLASDICDAYDKVEGDVKDGTFSGRHSWFGISGGKDIGTATATRVR